MRIIQILTFSYYKAGRNIENSHEYFMDDNLGVKLHGIYTRLTDKTEFASIRSTKELLQWIDKIEPDIIHLYCIHGYYINIELLFNYIKEKILGLYRHNMTAGLLQDIVCILMYVVVISGKQAVMIVNN